MLHRGKDVRQADATAAAMWNSGLQFLDAGR
jgi:hypothetical protein